MQQWYVIYVNARHEKKVVLELIEEQVIAYTPTVKKLKQWSDRKKWVEFPMLSGYVFVKINDLEKEKILKTSGVIGFIKFNGIEARVKESEIEILKSIELTGYDVTTEVNDLKMSDDVEIMQGSLKGYIGKIIQIQNEDYIHIELHSIKQNIRVKVPRNILKYLTH